VRAWSANIPDGSIPSSLDSETLLDETESSLADTLSVADTSAAVTTPTGPRYSKRPSHIFVLHFLSVKISILPDLF
jgi:hypothetical protein